MKILLLGEYSNVHATLSAAFRTLGHEVTLCSNGDFWKDYPRDIDVARQPGRWGGIKLMARVASLLPVFRGYDIVQLINPMFLELKAERLFPLYRYLCRHNHAVVLGAFGMDWYWVSECTTRKPLLYSDFNIGDELRHNPEAIKEQQDWLHTPKGRLNQFIAADCSHIVTGLYEYDVCYRPHFPHKTTYIPFPIRVAETKPNVSDGLPDAPLRIFVGISRGRSAYKGTDVMLRAARRVADRHPGRVELIEAEGVPFSTYQHMMDGADVILDQLYSYTPSMNSLLAMSKGIVVVGGGEEDHYRFIGEHTLRPIVNVRPSEEDVCQQLEHLLANPQLIPQLKRQSVEYVWRHHHWLSVAQRYLSLYQTL